MKTEYNVHFLFAIEFQFNKERSKFILLDFSLGTTNIMGGAPSTNAAEIAAAAMQKRTQEEVIAFVMPIYYSKAPLLPHEKEQAIKAWRYISAGQSPEFFRLKKEDPNNVPCKSPMEFFGNQFYRRLLEVHPTCRGLFTKSTMKQGQLLLRMISFAVSELDEDESKFIKTFQNLATCHNKIGVKACECK